MKDVRKNMTPQEKRLLIIMVVATAALGIVIAVVSSVLGVGISGWGAN